MLLSGRPLVAWLVAGVLALGVVALVVVVVAALARSQPGAGVGAPTASGSFGIGPATTTLVGAGDIGSCASGGDEATAAIIDHVQGTVVTLGDNVYENGTADEFAACYGPSWGAFRDRTRS